ncbi:uncharacterized protein BJX67DRAFT_389940 [Aspergillus lucknowensis]|uniref:Alcohol acetyltransferase n=1 Tax=Aspergillus lucknowensis TaxID=176173 RepID=A0ABR4M3Q7_9EURO
MEPETLSTPFGGAEYIYRRVGLTFKHLHREHWRIHGVCKISFVNIPSSEQVTSLRNAWKALVIKHPRLAVVPNGTTFKSYKILENAEDVEAWANETFFLESDRSSDEIVRTTGPRDLPSLHFNPASCELVLLASHWRMDAVGCMMVFDQLFTLTTQKPVSSPKPTEEQIHCISPPLEDAAACPPMDSSPSSTASKTYAERWIDNMHKKAINACGLPYEGENTTPPGETTQKDLNFSPSATSDLVKSCKAKGISVSAAIHAALAHTVFSFSPDGEKSDYTTVMAVNLRPYLPTPYNGPEHAVQTYVASIIPTVPRGEDFTPAARDLTTSYKTWYNDESVRSLRWIYAIHAEKLFNAPKPAASAPPPKPPSGVTLSSLGIVESYLRHQYVSSDGEVGKGVRVEGFRFGVTMMTRQMLLYVWTWKGRLTISACYNEAYYSEGMVSSVLGRLKGILEKELAYKLDVE